MRSAAFRYLDFARENDEMLHARAEALRVIDEVTWFGPVADPYDAAVSRGAEVIHDYGDDAGTFLCVFAGSLYMMNNSMGPWAVEVANEGDLS